jgi:hypothetical protein
MAKFVKLLLVVAVIGAVVYVIQLSRLVPTSAPLVPSPLM